MILDVLSGGRWVVEKVREYKQYYVEFKARVLPGFGVVVASLLNKVFDKYVWRFKDVEFRDKYSARIVFDNDVELKVGYDIYDGRVWLHVSLPMNVSEGPISFGEELVEALKQVFEKEDRDGG